MELPPRNPNSFCCWATQHDGTPGGSNGEGLVVIAFHETQFRSRPHSPVLEKLQQAPVAFINAAHRVTVSRFSLRQKEQSASPSASGTFQFADIPVGTSATATQFG